MNDLDFLKLLVRGFSLWLVTRHPESMNNSIPKDISVAEKYTSYILGEPPKSE